MYFFDAVKDNLVFSTSFLTKINFDSINNAFRVIKVDAAQTDSFLAKDVKPSANFSILNTNKEIDKTLSLQETPVFCVVNKYNELVKASPRLFYSNSIKSKSIYCLFLSKQDAIDFLYKVANTEPLAFKKSGLGINSFSLKDFFKLAENNKTASQVFLINDLQEVEKFIKNSKKVSKDFIFTFDKSIDFSKPINGILVYRLDLKSKDSALSNKYFLKINDVFDEWYSFSKNTSIPLKKNIRPIVHLSVISQSALSRLVL